MAIPWGDWDFKNCSVYYKGQKLEKEVEYEVDTSVTVFEFRADEGYHFETDDADMLDRYRLENAYVYIGSWLREYYWIVKPNLATVTYNEDKTIMYCDYANTGNFAKNIDYFPDNRVSLPHIQAYPKVEGKKVFITGTLENCTCNYNDGDTINPNKNIEIVANEGFSFEGEYEYIYGFMAKSMDNDGQKLSIDVKANPDYDITLDDTYTATKKTVTHAITEHLSHITSDFNGLPVEDGTPVTINYTADNNYTIKSLNSTLGNVIIEEDKLKATLTIDSVTSDVTVEGVGEPIPKTCNIVQTLNNSTSDFDGNSVNAGDNLTIQYVASDGYTITSIDTTFGDVVLGEKGATATLTMINITESVSITVNTRKLNQYTIEEHLTGVRSDNKLTTVTEYDKVSIVYTTLKDYKINYEKSIFDVQGQVSLQDDTMCLWSVDSVTGNIVNTVVAEKDLVKYSVTQNIDEYTTSDFKGTTIDEGSNVTITLTTTRIFTDVTSNVGTVAVSDNKKTATITITNVNKNVIINATTKASYTVSITGELINCTCNYSDGETIDLSKNVVITAKEGYEFKGQYEYKYIHMTKEMTNNGTTLTIDVQYTPNGNIELDDIYDATLKVPTLSSFTNIYNVNDSILTELSKVRFVTGTTVETVDYGIYIDSLYVLPFKPPAGVISEVSKNIILGYYDSNIKANVTYGYNFKYNLGSIIVPNKYNNVYDYINTSVILHLPYCNNINLEPHYVIGHTLSVEYNVDLYSGDCTVNIISSFVNGIVHSEPINLVTKIPFIRKRNGNVINDLAQVVNNGLSQCYVEVTRNIPYNVETIWGVGVEEDVLTTGYVEVSDISFKSLATSIEKEKIKDLLKRGVYINEN